MIALIDANSFFASCEQVYRPDLRGKPVVVLSNNDGCVIARNAEAKLLGIPMGEPYFRCRDFLRARGVAVFSSNYGLYADISNRVMQTIATFAPALEVYSIDECFVDAGGLSDLEALGREWRQIIRQWTGITCGIGFGPSKTLAKLANHAAKQYPKTGGVVDLSDPVRQRRLLAITPVEEVWGIGRRLGQHLRALGIQTALQLADSHPGWIRQRFNVVMARTVAELNGQSCLQLEEVRPPKQQIISSRSFSNAITDPEALCEAVAEYTARAAEKLRSLPVALVMGNSPTVRSAPLPWQHRRPTPATCCERYARRRWRYFGLGSNLPRPVSCSPSSAGASGSRRCFPCQASAMIIG